ncbi:MAG TPA: NAD(P)H-dependent oxidoreductase [Jatrophihabitans sp.]
MPDVDAPQVTVRFWAGARRAAGCDSETLGARTVGELRDLLAARAALAPVCAVASFLVDGRQASDTTALTAGAEVDVLPPFAGGSAPTIVGIGGSAREGSLTNLLLTRCLDKTAELGARTRALLGPQLAGLPMYGEDNDPAGSAELVDAVRTADCVVIGTPGYHGGMSGLVKNAIDHLELLREDPRPYLSGKAVGVIVTAAGWQACGTTLTSVRSAVHALRGWPTPFGVIVNSVEQQADDVRIDGALAILAAQLVEFASWRTAASATVR